jgi:hypothetical protein
MNRQDILYLLIVFCFAGGYLGGLLSNGAYFMYIFLAAGIILFGVRIIRGDD